MLDANGTRHHLILGRDDWLSLTDVPASDVLLAGVPIATSSPPAAASATRFNDTRAELTLAPLPLEALPPPVHGPPSLEQRRGVAADAGGNVYQIDRAAASILVQSARDGSTGVLFSTRSGAPSTPAPAAGEFASTRAATVAPLTLAGLAITTEEYLVAGTAGPTGLLVFDLRAGGPPRQILWPPGLALSPFELAPTPDGGLLILDRAAARYWQLDRLFEVALRSPAAGPAPPAGNFAPVKPTPGSPPRRTDAALRLSDSVALTGDPISIAALPDGFVVTLDHRDGHSPSWLRVHRGGSPVGEPLELADPGLGVSVVGHDMAVGPPLASDPADVAAHAYVASATGAQAYDFVLSVVDGQLRVQLTPQLLVTRSFGGRGLAAGPTGPLYDAGDRWATLVCQPQSAYRQRAMLTTRTYDGGDPGCVWHRLLLDAAIPAGCEVRISSRAADDQPALQAAEFTPEPALARRPGGPEQPYLSDPAGFGYATWETLIQRATGRWLQLEVQITGDGRRSPRLRALRIYYPRFSYLHRYLPAMYRRDTLSASFLDRYLANVEGINTTIEDRIAAAQALLDPRCVPAGALDWLASFFDVALDGAWIEHRRRLFIAHAISFFNARGTVRGLQIALRMALDPLVDARLFNDPTDPRTLAYRIVELFHTPPPESGADGAQAPAPAPRVVTGQGRWTPAQGLAVLLARYAEFRAAAAVTPAPVSSFVLSAPPQPKEAAVWSAFVEQMFGFEVTARGDGVQGLWAAFLRQRYRRVDSLNAAYATGGQPHAGFDVVPLPVSVPPDGPAQSDWFQFASVVLAGHRAAHRFVVLLPIPADAASDPTNVDPDGHRALATRIVELQKPAHTQFEVRYYWSALRVGSARLGDDTAIGTGSRAAQLLVPATVGQDYIGASYLGGPASAQLGPTPSVGRDTTLNP